MEGKSWLLPDGKDRERMLDMDRRLQPVRRAAFGVLGVALIAMGPWIGWWTLIPLAVASLIFKFADDHIERVERPEYAMFAAWATSEVIIAISVALCGGPTVATLSWLAIPIVTLSARFSFRGVALGVATALGLLAIVAFGMDTAAVLADPTIVIAPAALIGAVAMLSTALMQSDLEHRSEAVLDQLTGMLNRKALATRADELSCQSEVSGDPVGLVIGDLDHFKRINDSHGHAVGDWVLKDVAYVLRKNLRAFDLVYRIGGEEFLVLLPGSEREQTMEVAEELRRAIASETVGGGLHMTMSFGVAASEEGRAFDYLAVFSAADAALYEAKRSGRDRVCSGVESLSPAAVPVPA
jgi:diguanylate cyclase (GGDEF)-like protein